MGGQVSVDLGNFVVGAAKYSQGTRIFTMKAQASFDDFVNHLISAPVPGHNTFATAIGPSG